jgi:hypothetical protein
MKYGYMNYFPPELNDGNHVFVFGSNLLGIHGAGAAKEAVKYWGARNGHNAGLCGRSYAIPTKAHWRDEKGLSLEWIRPFVVTFIRFARDLHTTTFLVTPIGTGFAGYDHSEIAPMFLTAPVNCIFVTAWKEFLETEV